MNKPWSGLGSRAGTDYADAAFTDDSAYTDGYDTGYGTGRNYQDEPENYGIEDYDAYGGPDNRWRWVAGFAAVVLLVAIVATMAITRGGDSVSTSTPLTPLTTTPRTVIATAPSSTSPTPVPSPETVVTVTPSPSPTVETTPNTPAAAVAPPVPATTVTYTVTGTRQLLDLVTIIYTNEQGLPQTDLNVALPWTRRVVLDPGVAYSSVTATSLMGKLNCAITDANGATLVAQSNNTLIATCTH